MKLFLLGLLAVVSLLATAAVVFGNAAKRIPAVPHYHHADFAVFIDGQRLDFSQPQYTDPETCATGIFLLNDEQTYLQEGGLVIHAHQVGATYEDFFASVGISFDGRTFTDGMGNVYEEDAEKEFRVFLNEKEVDSVHDLLIEDLDGLLISYALRGRSESELLAELEQVPDLACFYSALCPYETPAKNDLCGADDYYRTMLYYWFGI